ncbi:MAG: transcription initiation factor TFIID subunit TAF11 [Amphiamblys sp. WSBS2006]|nr:MAG: transcription initiation factor TFIID subunit TAF11 [Amphiamblys sp. WSBS2006]
MEDETHPRKRKFDPYKANNGRTNRIIQNLAPEQMERYVSFKKASLNKKEVRRILQKTIETPISTTSEKQLLIAVSGATKIFVGELVEKAREVAAEWGEAYSGEETEENLLPLLPSHVSEAYRRLKETDSVLKKSRGFL